jgi:Raf kinase inhibitor-like YbhB/YbcL family protein
MRYAPAPGGTAGEGVPMSISTSFAPRWQVPAAAALLALATVAGSPAAVTADRLLVTSSSFADGATIPAAYAHAGCAAGAKNRSPQLSWHSGPSGTQSYAVTMFDPDAPTGHGFWHWIMFDIPATSHGLGAGAASSSALQHGAVLGQSDFGASEYDGPCPPPGDKPHHYVITVRALDIALLPAASKATRGPEFLAAVNGHVLAEGKLVGRFGR